MLGISCSRCFNSLLFNKWSMPTRQHAWYFMFTMVTSIRFCLTSGVCLYDNMLGISCSRCTLLFDKWSMPTRQHAWYFMFTMLQFASVWQVEYAYTTSCLVFHVHNASIRFCLTSGVCLHDNMLGISCSQCFNSLLFNKWSMPTRQHAWYFMFTMLQFASVWQVEYAYTTTCLVFHVHDASIRFCLTSGVCLHDNMLGISCSRCFNSLLFNKWSMPRHDIMLGISCSRCFNSLLFNKWSMPTRQHAWYFMFTMLQFASVYGVCLYAWYFMSRCIQFASVWQVEYAYTTTCLVFHVHDASIRFCLTSGVCLHDIMLGISCSQCFNSLLFDKWSMPTRQHAWYFMFTMLQFASV